MVRCLYLYREDGCRKPSIPVHKSKALHALFFLCLVASYTAIFSSKAYAQSYYNGAKGIPVLSSDALRLVNVLEHKTGEKLFFTTGVGDINNDGYDDIVTTNFVNSYIYLGNPQFTFSTAYQLAGGYFLPTGDVNSDGFADLLVVKVDTVYGDTKANLSLFYGSRVLGERIIPFYETTWKSRGTFLNRMQKIGDINGDGYDDIVFSSPFNALSDGMGWVYIFAGGPEAPQQPMMILHSNKRAAFDRFGFSVCGLGDINHDGYDDFLVDAPTTGPSLEISKVYLYYGGAEPDSIPDRIFQPTDNIPSEFSIVAGAGDLNRDNIPDFFISGDFDKSTRLYSDIHDSTVISSFNGLNPLYVGTGGDINNDGYNDYLLANDTHDLGNGIIGGLAKVYFGGPVVNPEPRVTIAGYTQWARFGNYLEIIGDYNGDGFDDVIIGEPAYNRIGRAFVYSYNSPASTDPTVKNTNYFLYQNYPNPFNPSTEITFTLAEGNFTSLVVFNTLGQKIATLADHIYLNKGKHTYQFNASEFPAGVYMYQLQTEATTLSRKMVFLK